MTQAFNLAQLANNLNTSGQLDATDGLNGLVANANLASSGTASSSTFLRGDRTWATAGLQAATSAEAIAGTSNTVAITPLQLRNGLNSSGSAPIYACRAWVNFNGTGTVAIRASGNVSSITDRATGKYTVNFATAMQDANYCATYTPSAGDPNTEDNREVCISNLSTGSFYVTSSDSGDNLWADAAIVCAAVFR